MFALGITRSAAIHVGMTWVLGIPVVLRYFGCCSMHHDSLGWWCAAIVP